MTNDHYTTLGLPPNATPNEIKRAYRTRAQRLHPDKGGSAEGFAELEEAYRILGDAASRQRYDAGQKPEGPPSPEAIARARLAALFTALLDSPAPDLRRAAEEQIGQALGQIRSRLAEIAQQKKTLEKRLKATGWKGKGEDILAGVITSKLQALLGDQNNVLAEKDIAGKMQVLLKDYEYTTESQIDPFIQSQQFAFRQFIWTGTGTTR